MNNLKNKMIIRNYTDLDDIDVIKHIDIVVAQGKISENKNGKCYCLVTTFKTGYVVSVEPRGDTTTFYFYKEEGNKC